MKKKGVITKQKIVDVSLDLFGSKGYDGTTMADIMKDTGLSKGALYHHFTSKEDIADTAIQEFSDQVEAAFSKIVEQPISALEKLMAITTQKQAIYGEKMNAFMSILASPKSSRLKEKLQRANRQTYVEAMESIITQGQIEKTFKTADDPAIIAHFIFGIQESYYKLPSEILGNPEKFKSYQITGTHLMCSVMGIDENFFDKFF